MFPRDNVEMDCGTLSYVLFIEVILAPSAICCMIEEDLGIAEDAAWKILLESTDVGDVIGRADDADEDELDTIIASVYRRKEPGED